MEFALSTTAILANLFALAIPVIWLRAVRAIQSVVARPALGWATVYETCSQPLDAPRRCAVRAMLSLAIHAILQDFSVATHAQALIPADHRDSRFAASARSEICV